MWQPRTAQSQFYRGKPTFVSNYAEPGRRGSCDYWSQTALGKLSSLSCAYNFPNGYHIVQRRAAHFWTTKSLPVERQLSPDMNKYCNWSVPHETLLQVSVCLSDMFVYYWYNRWKEKSNKVQYEQQLWGTTFKTKPEWDSNNHKHRSCQPANTESWNSVSSSPLGWQYRPPTKTMIFITANRFDADEIQLLHWHCKCYSYIPVCTNSSTEYVGDIVMSHFPAFPHVDASHSGFKFCMGVTVTFWGLER